jgi:hypothetical protein
MTSTKDSRPRDSGMDIGADEYQTCAGSWHLDLTDTTISTTAVHEACRTITAGPNLVINAPGDVMLRAGTSVTLTNGFGLSAGAKLRFELDPSL